MIKRKEYLNKILDYKDKHIIKVFTGMRRCGKSTLLNLYIDELLKMGIALVNIISINLENPEILIYDYKSLYDYVNVRLQQGMNYVFIDEVQNIDCFEKAINGLFLKNNIDIYITGSNAKMLSSEIATLLTGRYIEINVMPFSFEEYTTAYANVDNVKLFLDYIEVGGMPELLEFDKKSNKMEYLRSVISTILNKDILKRLNEKNKMTIDSILRYILANVGNFISVKKITDTLISSGKKIGLHTVENYVESFVDSFIVNKVYRFDVLGKEILKTQNKYYVVDTGIIGAYLGVKAFNNIGFMIENIVYNELHRRENEVYVGKLRDGEIDFVTKGDYGIKYYQVAYDTKNQDTLKRELAPLLKIKDNYEKILLAYDNEIETEYEGIKIMGVMEWLSE